MVFCKCAFKLRTVFTICNFVGREKYSAYDAHAPPLSFADPPLIFVLLCVTLRLCGEYFAL